MEKKIILGICMVLLITYITLPYAISFGLLPSSKTFKYLPQEQEGSFKIMLSRGEESKRFIIYVEGTLKDYIELEDKVIDVSSSKREAIVRYKVKQPKELGPGKLEGKIIVLELSYGSDAKEDSPIVTATASLVHKVIVYKPYPNEFVEAIAYVTSNKEKEALIRLDLYNRGKKPTEVRGQIEILGPINEKFDLIMLNNTRIEPGEMKSIAIKWNAPNAGAYVANFKLTYSNKIIELNKVFKVTGKPLQIIDLNIMNFKLGEIAKVKLKVRSNWNKPLENLFGEIEVINQDGAEVMKFKTVPFSLQPLEIKEVEAFWDTSGIGVGQYTFRTKFNVLDQVVDKLFKINVGLDSVKVIDQETVTAKVIESEVGKEEQSNYLLQIIATLVIVLIIVNIIFFIFILKKVNKK